MDVSIIVEEPWYHGDISWEDAEQRLNAQDSDCFLMRKSQSQPGKYVLSVSYGIKGMNEQASVTGLLDWTTGL